MSLLGFRDAELSFSHRINSGERGLPINGLDLAARVPTSCLGSEVCLGCLRCNLDGVDRDVPRDFEGPSWCARPRSRWRGLSRDKYISSNFTHFFPGPVKYPRHFE